ncbi:MAG TPA: hypothetical protein VMM80_00550 [Bacteroidota bacterium]|nr:hypothetical protein [Bacteroidota bacterium]
MFIGHYAVALAAKKAAPRTSLGTLFMAAQFVDLLWPLLLLAGVEHVQPVQSESPFLRLEFTDYPVSHSLAGAVVWSLVLGGLYRLIRRETRGALVVGACVFSHWVLDFLTHRPDLPLWFSGGPHVGLGLWNSVVGTGIVEGGLFLAGAAVYLKTTQKKGRIGAWAIWSLLAVLAAIYSGEFFGPPPPDVRAIGIAANASWLFVFWAYWADAHRRALSRQETA